MSGMFDAACGNNTLSAANRLPFAGTSVFSVQDAQVRRYTTHIAAYSVRITPMGDTAGLQHAGLGC